MPSILPTAFPLLYDEGFKQALQQKAARSRPFVNVIPMNGKLKRFNKIGKSEAVPITTRFGTTNPNELEYEYRSLKIGFWKDPKRVDRREAMMLGSIGGPQDAIMLAQRMSANRNFDQTLVNGLLGPSWEGENGDQSVALPTTNDIPAANVSLTFDKVNAIKTKFGLLNIDGQDVEGNSNIVLLCTHNELATLRNTEKFTSMWYQGNKLPLAGSGNIESVLGITVVALDPALLPYNSSTGVRTCIAYAKEHIRFGIAEDIFTSVDQLIDGNLDWQLYAEWGWGATRLYDDAVIRVYCDDIP